MAWCVPRLSELEVLSDLGNRSWPRRRQEPRYVFQPGQDLFDRVVLHPKYQDDQPVAAMIVLMGDSAIQRDQRVTVPPRMT